MESIQFDPYALTGTAEPELQAQEMVRTCPIAHSDQHGGFWVLSAYDDVVATARRAELFSSEIQGASIPYFDLGFEMGPIMVDPPRHMQYRAPLVDRFAPRAVNLWEPRVRDVATSLIDGFIERGTADLAREFAVPLPSIVASEFLGFPSEDYAQLKDWAEVMLGEDLMPKVMVVPEIFAYFAKLYHERATDDRDDIVNLVRRSEIDGGPISLEHFQGAMVVLFTAGLETTANAAGNIFELLNRRRDLREALITAPEKIPSAVEEFLRYISPVPLSGRTAREAGCVGSQSIDAGERIGLFWLAANYDPAEFEAPDEFQIERHPNRHVAFGNGPHHCLGAHLARLELRVMLEEILTRLPDYEVLEDGVERYAAITRGVSGLKIRFSPGQCRGNEEVS